jgi:hypothetical protein
MTNTFSIFSILCCLKEALKFGNAEDQIWRSTNESQKRFLDSYYQYALEYMDIFSKEELSCIASSDYDEVNAFLKDKGFDIQLSGGGEFGVASVLDLFCKWKGESSVVRVFDQFLYSKTYEGVRLDGESGIVLCDDG